MIKKQFLFKSGSTYNLPIMLTANIKDWGTFDTFNEESTGLTTTVISDLYSISGSSSSRLEELRTYSVSTDINKQYKTSNDLGTNGLDVGLSTITGSVKTYVYYINNIKYVDTVTTGETTTNFYIENIQYSDGNFDNLPYLKNDDKHGMVENPKIDKDVFIVRQEASVFERNFRIRAITSINEMLQYAGGNYFKIYDNT